MHVYDIGSASVAGAVALFQEGMSPRILYTIKKDLSFSTQPDGTRMTDTVSAAFAETVRMIERRTRDFIREKKYTLSDNVLVVLSAPWYVSQSRHINVTHQTPVRVREDDIREYVEKEYQHFLASPVIADFLSEGCEPFERRITRVLLNGYETATPEGQDAEQIDISAVFSIMPEKMAESIRRAITDERSVAHVSFSAFPLVAYHAIRSGGLCRDDFLFLDIAGEISDFSLVKNGALSDSVSFPVGKTSVVRRIADILHISFSEATSLFQTYIDGKLSEKDMRSSHTAIEAATGQWLRAFEHALSSLAHTHSLPKTVYITSDSDVSRFFAGSINRQETKNFSYGTGTFSAVVVDTAYLYEKHHVASDVEHDVFLTLAVIFASHEIIYKTFSPPCEASGKKHTR